MQKKKRHDFLQKVNPFHMGFWFLFSLSTILANVLRLVSSVFPSCHKAVYVRLTEGDMAPKFAQAGSMP
jgi:hypothetical protein